MPKLQINLPDGSKLDHELTEAVTVGRASDNVLPIDDASVSSYHAKIEPEGDSYKLTDLGSTNGTRLNGAVVNEGEVHVLNPGDKIRFGKVDTVFDPDSAEDIQDLPDGEHVAAVAESSVKPSNFMNASPFQKRTEKKDAVGTAVMVVGILAILAALAVTGLTFGLASGS